MVMLGGLNINRVRLRNMRRCAYCGERFFENECKVMDGDNKFYHIGCFDAMKNRLEEGSGEDCVSC